MVQDERDFRVSVAMWRPPLPTEVPGQGWEASLRLRGTCRMLSPQECTWAQVPPWASRGHQGGVSSSPRPSQMP